MSGAGYPSGDRFAFDTFHRHIEISDVAYDVQSPIVVEHQGKEVVSVRLKLSIICGAQR